MSTSQEGQVQPAQRGTPVKADCYSAGERRVMVWTQELRGWFFGPLLGVLARCRVTADHLTLLSLCLGLSFCLLYFRWPLAAYAMLVLHVLVDGLDGPLARRLGVASRRGSLTDSLADQLVVTGIALSWMAGPQPLIGVVPGGIYIFLYTLLVTFAMLRNALEIPYSWLIRPRFFVYSWMALESFVFPGTVLHGTIDYVLWLFNLLLAVKVLTGYLQIRYRI